MKVFVIVLLAVAGTMAAPGKNWEKIREAVQSIPDGYDCVSKDIKRIAGGLGKKDEGIATKIGAIWDKVRTKLTPEINKALDLVKSKSLTKNQWDDIKDRLTELVNAAVGEMEKLVNALPDEKDDRIDGVVDRYIARIGRSTTQIDKQFS